jgi:hypothetical protein
VKAYLRLGLAIAFATAGQLAFAAFTNNILITGFWPPTNEMIRPWSTNPVQNPNGWIGGNWEGRGYDVFSFFPEFPNGMDGDNARGEGDLEVDYQDTSADFWRIVADVRPVAIMTFSRGSGNRSWEIESRTRKLPLDQWAPDYLEPRQPTPDLPIAGEPDNNIRTSTLPMTAIRDAVNDSGLNLGAYVDDSNSFAGGFVSEFMGYHGSWYQDIHGDESDDSWCVAGGHIHVGFRNDLETARAATEISLRILIDYVNSVVPEPSSGLGLLALAGLARGWRGRR